jgi:polyisoprenoid-binding protein YceI
MATTENSTNITSKIVGSRSRVEVKAFATGILSSFGHNPTFRAREVSGEIRYDPAEPEKSTFHLRIRADSLDLADDVSAKDREEIMKTMREEVLEISRYPEISFESTTVSANKIYEGSYRVTASGKLHLHGTTREHMLETNVNANGQHLRINGETTINQSDFNIRVVKVAAGALKLKDEIKITFDLVAQ